MCLVFADIVALNDNTESIYWEIITVMPIITSVTNVESAIPKFPFEQKGKR